MDPKIGWLQEELKCKAYEIWNETWNSFINSQIRPIQIINNESKVGFNSNARLNESQSDCENTNTTASLNALFQNQDQSTNSSNTDLTKLRKPQKSTNKASIQFNINSNNQQLLNDRLNMPWIPANFKYDDGYNGLHEEILLFNQYISPTIEEIYMRDEVISKLIRVILRELPNAQVDIFGSYKTGLFLPTSDIDMVVFGEWKHLPLNCLKHAIIREQISDDENVKVLDKASVPIIKMIEIKTELKIDISFNTTNGVKSALLIKKFLNDFPSLRPLVMVVKHFILQCDFNEVWTGGIGSYSLILMIISFLQMHPRLNPYSANENLGILLIEFFELYGKYFNYSKTAIRVKDGGSYLVKEDIRKQFSNNHSSILCIEDPLNTSNDIGKGSYSALKVRQAFEYAYLTLSHAVLPHNKFLLTNNPSILGRILRITKDIQEYRSKIKNLYKDKISLNSTTTTDKLIPVIIKPLTSEKQQQQQENGSDKKVKFYIGDDTNLYNNNNPNDINNNVNSNKNLLSLFSYESSFLLSDCNKNCNVNRYHAINSSMNKNISNSSLTNVTLIEPKIIDNSDCINQLNTIRGQCVEKKQECVLFDNQIPRHAISTPTTTSITSTTASISSPGYYTDNMATRLSFLSI